MSTSSATPQLRKELTTARDAAFKASLASDSEVSSFKQIIEKMTEEKNELTSELSSFKHRQMELDGFFKSMEDDKGEKDFLDIFLG